ncbi:MAG: HIRAN domain-containing protein [Paludibacteraceae bacterium]
MKLIENKKHFMHFDIAGFSYHEGCLVMDELKPGTRLKLVHEDENKYDHNAIAILLGDTVLGYVPRAKNSDLAMFMEMGYANLFEAYIQTIDTETDLEHQVGVIIYLKRNVSAH